MSKRKFTGYVDLDDLLAAKVGFELGSKGFALADDVSFDPRRGVVSVFNFAFGPELEQSDSISCFLAWSQGNVGRAYTDFFMTGAIMGEAVAERCQRDLAEKAEYYNGWRSAIVCDPPRDGSWIQTLPSIGHHKMGPREVRWLKNEHTPWAWCTSTPGKFVDLDDVGYWRPYLYDFMARGKKAQGKYGRIELPRSRHRPPTAHHFYNENLLYEHRHHRQIVEGGTIVENR